MTHLLRIPAVFLRASGEIAETTFFEYWHLTLRRDPGGRETTTRPVGPDLGFYHTDDVFVKKVHTRLPEISDFPRNSSPHSELIRLRLTVLIFDVDKMILWKNRKNPQSLTRPLADDYDRWPRPGV